MSAFERVGGNAIDTPTQARERLGSHGGAADLKPGTTMGRIASLEQQAVALETAAASRIRAAEVEIGLLQNAVVMLRADVDALRKAAAR
jgi:hypothetical protein